MSEQAYQPVTEILRYFEYRHLPNETWRNISKQCALLAWEMERLLPDGPEKSAGLRKLLEAKDCFVRAILPKNPVIEPPE